MYKLMYRIRTMAAPNVFAFWGEKLEDGTVIEYVYETEEEVKKAGCQLAKKIGTDDIRIVRDEDYYLKLIYGMEPTPEPDTYSIILTGLDKTETIENIIANSSVSTDYIQDLENFHIVINGEAMINGLPEWVVIENGIMTINYINQNYTFEIILH
jgi:hypothetical protein